MRLIINEPGVFVGTKGGKKILEVPT